MIPRPSTPVLWVLTMMLATMGILYGSQQFVGLCAIWFFVGYMAGKGRLDD